VFLQHHKAVLTHSAASEETKGIRIQGPINHSREEKGNGFHLTRLFPDPLSVTYFQLLIKYHVIDALNLSQKHVYRRRLSSALVPTSPAFIFKCRNAGLPSSPSATAVQPLCITPWALVMAASHWLTLFEWEALKSYRNDLKT